MEPVPEKYSQWFRRKITLKFGHASHAMGGHDVKTMFSLKIHGQNWWVLPRIQNSMLGNDLNLQYLFKTIHLVTMATQNIFSIHACLQFSVHESTVTSNNKWKTSSWPMLSSSEAWACGMPSSGNQLITGLLVES